jgi:acyl-coenzyme A synthetase/AMP-(fatty) acid ligase
MGDLGWMDEKGRSMVLRRKNHRVITEDGTLFTVPLRGDFYNSHPAVYRSALIGVQAGIKQRAVICIEPKNGCTEKNREKLREELLDIAKSNELTKRIQTILFHNAFPVDIRHNSKIFREQLAVWAEKQMKSAHEKNRFPIE